MNTTNNIGALRLAMVTLSLFNFFVRFGYFKTTANQLIGNEYLAILAALFVAGMLEVLLWAFMPDFTDAVLNFGNGQRLTNSVNIGAFVAVCFLYAYTDYAGCEIAAHQSIVRHEAQSADVTETANTMLDKARQQTEATNARTEATVKALEKSRVVALRKSPRDAAWINSTYDKKVNAVRAKADRTNEKTMATAMGSATSITKQLSGIEALKLKRDMQLNGHEITQAQNKSGMWRFLTIGCALLVVAAGLTKRRQEITLNIEPKHNKAFDLLADSTHSALTGFAHLVAFVLNLLGQAQRIEQPRLIMRAKRGGLSEEAAAEIATINQRIATNMTRLRSGANVQHLIDRDRELLAKIKGLS